MIRSLIPWTQLTRAGVPEFKVCRSPITTEGVTFDVGSTIPADTFANRVRLRQMYEQRRIEPVNAPPHSRQAHRPATRPVVASVAPVASVTPILDAPSIPVVEETLRETRPSRPRAKANASRNSGYTPSRSTRNISNKPGAKK